MLRNYQSKSGDSCIAVHVVVGPLGDAFALVRPFGVARGRREIATVRALRRFRGGSRRVGAGMGVLVGRPRAGQGGAGASQGPNVSRRMGGVCGMRRRAAVPATTPARPARTLSPDEEETNHRFT